MVKGKKTPYAIITYFLLRGDSPKDFVMVRMAYKLFMDAQSLF
jgi:hypothetical protein